MPYTRAQNWVDGYDGRTPITAAALNHIEDGLVAATSTAESASTAGTAAQTKVDAVASTALVAGIAWTSSWFAESALSKTLTEVTTSNNASTVNNTNTRMYAPYSRLPENRTYRLHLVVSATASATIWAGAFFGTPTGGYGHSNWGPISVPAGTVYKHLFVDVVSSYRTGEDRVRFICGVMAGGEPLTIHLVTVEDVTELVAAQTTANAAQTTANAAQTTANAAQTTANAAVTTEALSAATLGGLQLIVGTSASVTAGGYITQVLSYGAHSSTPRVIPFLIMSSAFKGFATAHSVTTSSCTVRVDNVGTSAGSVTPAVLVIGA